MTSSLDIWTQRLMWIFGAVCVPISIFYPASPNVTFAGLGVLSLVLLFSKGELNRLVPPIKAIFPFLLFVGWALVSYFWSVTPEASLKQLGKILLALAAAAAFFSALNEERYNRFIPYFKYGYDVALLLLILDEILNTRILRTLHGPTTDAVEYYHGLTILVIGIWPVMNAYQQQHASHRVLLFGLLLLVIFEQPDHATRIAVVLGLVTWGVTYLAPKIIMRLTAGLAVVFMLTLPLGLQYMDPVELSTQYPSLMVKPSYQHRLFILKHANNQIWEAPLLGHGLDAFRKRSEIKTDQQVVEELKRINSDDTSRPVDYQLLGEGSHPHNLTLQLWFELGLVGALLYALFIGALLWRISGLQDRGYRQATFNAMFVSFFTIAHISFGAWQGWWLFSVGILAALALWQTVRQQYTDQQMEPLQP